MKKKIFYMSNGSYFGRTIYCQNIDEGELRKYLEKFKVKVTNSYFWEDYSKNTDARARCFSLGGCNVLIKWQIGDPKKCIPEIAHECLHACEFLFDEVGLPHTKSTAEAWAYQLSMYIFLLLEGIKDQKNNWDIVKKDLRL